MDEIEKLYNDLKVDNCILSFQCNEKIELMQCTDDKDVKFCSKCEQNVFICHSFSDIVKHTVSQKHCIAYSNKEIKEQSPYKNLVIPSTSSDMTVGLLDFSHLGRKE